MNDQNNTSLATQIQQEVNIVDIISQYVQIKKRGKNYFGFCPFHEERTPSFSVNEEKQIFYCFSCRRGGSVFSFISEMEHLTFPQSLAKVIDLAQLDYSTKHLIQQNQFPKTTQHAKLYEIHEHASKLYEHILLRTQGGDQALTYLQERGYTLETIQQFHMGFSLKNRTTLLQSSKNLNLSVQEMQDSGLFVTREINGEQIDRFFERIMIPLIDEHQQVIGFSGRILPQSELLNEEEIFQAKYLNSPETPLFNKRKFLFNFNQARNIIRKLNTVVLFEGYMDVIAAWQAGVQNGIASMGTSLTQEQIHVIQRVCEHVIIAYDGDMPGLQATLRAIELLEQHANVRISIFPLEEGLDPDEYIKKVGATVFKERLFHHTETVFAFKQRYYKNIFNISNEKERIDYLEKLMIELAKISSPIERDFAITDLVNEFQLTKSTIEKQVRRYLKQSHPTKTQMIAYPAELSSDDNNQRVLVQKQLLSRLLHFSEAWLYLETHQPDFVFPNDDFQFIFTLMKEYRKKHQNEINYHEFLSILAPQERNLVTSLEWLTLANSCSEQELADILFVLTKKLALEEENQQIPKKLQEAMLRNNQAEVQRLLKRKIEIQKELTKRVKTTHATK